MEKAGVGVNNPSELFHASPCFFAKRPRKPKLRLCYACVDLNKVTMDLVHPLPLMSDVIEQLKGKKYFTLIDLKSGYWQVALTECAQKYVGMTTQLGTFAWKVLPFGLAHFQREMRDTLGELLDVCASVYIDDVIIYISRKSLIN